MIELPQVYGSNAMQEEESNLHVNPRHGNSNTDMSTAVESYRAKALRFLVAAAGIAFVSVLASSAFNTSSPKTKESLSSQVAAINSSQNHFDWVTHEPLSFHQSGFGALNFHHHEDGASKFRRYLDSTNVVIPKSAVPHATPSLGAPNIINLHGHYVHDEHRSPWASTKYARPIEELKQEQAEHLEKMEKVRQEWGFWSFKDHANVVRPIQDFSKIPYKDIKSSEWQENVWQKDEKYVKDLIEEGRKLVDRMTESIYAELGFEANKKDGTLSAEDIEARNEKFKVHLYDHEEVEWNFKMFYQGAASMSHKALDGLARKLLHAMMTNDEFYVVMGGHSAAAGHGNTIHHQWTMQLSYIMEPVFQKLGMRFIARNMAMGGYGTLHFSAGQKELYGEKDVLMWDSAMTEKAQRDIELFLRQAMLNGERVPVIYTDFPFNLMKETGGRAWLAQVIGSVEGPPKTTSIEQGRTLPWAVQFLDCAEGAQELCGARSSEKWNEVCWIDRSDVEIPDKNMINRAPGGQASWHPGWRFHQLQSRKTALTFLLAFKKAFDVWEDGMKADGFPLKEKYWHVGSIYKETQEALHSYITGEGKGQSECEKFYEQYELEKWCYTVMHGMTQFTPVNLGAGNDIIHHLTKPASGHPKALHSMLYSGPDLLAPKWKIPKGDVDVHAVAIATNYEAPQLDHEWEDEGDDDDVEEDAEDSRRHLRQVHEDVSDAADNDVGERILSSTGIVPGEWGRGEYLKVADDEYCDGSPMSECNRRIEGNGCLMYGNNDRHDALMGDGTTGWVVINIPEVKEGIIWAKLQWWYPRDYKFPDVHEGERLLSGEEQSQSDRNLGNAVPLPDDFFFDFAVNGKITTWDKEKMMSQAYPEMAYNEAFYRMVNDETLKGPVEFAMRARSESDPGKAGFSITHMYWA